MDLHKLRRQQPTSKAGEDGDFVQLQKVRERVRLLSCTTDHSHSPL